MANDALTTEIDVLKRLAISKCPSLRVGDEDRGEVEAGEYAVDFWFHVQGTLSVGKDTQTTQTNKID